MLLKNKKTGEIAEPFGITCINGRTFVQFNDEKGTFKFEARSLSELNEEWEDYEEPKEYWFIDEFGLVQKEIEYYYEENKEAVHDKRIAVGNYFETRDEAEKAVEKLKAWKRLKDKGFRFDLSPALGHCDDKKFDISIIGTMPAKWWYNDKVVDDIHYFFGGEE